MVAHYDEKLASRLRRFGEEVRIQRLRVGLSQEGLADRCGMHRTYIGSVERGERNVTLGSAWALAGALDVTLGELLPDGR